MKVRLPVPTGIVPAELSVVWLALTGAAPGVGAGVNVHGIPFRRLVFLALAPLALASCGGRSNIALAEQCHEQIMLSLAPGVGRTDRVMEGLEDDANVRLEYLRSAGPTLFVYKLSTRDRDPGCVSALSRLRQDSRVRFAESDRQRAMHGFAK